MLKHDSITAASNTTATAINQESALLPGTAELIEAIQSRLMSGQRSESRDVVMAHASARFRLLIASSISCVFLKPIVAQSTPAFWKANLIAFTRSS